MITIESLNSTRDLIAVLADKGVRLKAIEGSPVDEAMKATKIWGNSINCLTEIDGLPDKLYRPNEVVIQPDGSSEEDMHSAYLNASSAALGIQLASHIAYATSVVLPAVGECYEAITNARDLDASCGVLSYKVEMVEGSPLLDLTDVTDAIGEFSRISAANELPFVLDFQEKSAEEIVELMKIGSSGYDNAVAQFAEQVGAPFLVDVWNTVFCSRKNGYPNYDVYRGDRTNGHNRNWAVFLLAKKLINDKDNLPAVTGAAGFSAGKYGVALRQLIEVSGRALAFQLDDKMTQERLGKLIASTVGKTVFVNKTIYDRFMADGGDIEVILGAVVSGKQNLLVGELAEQSATLKNAWGYHVTRAKMDAASSELLTVRNTIFNFVRRYLIATEDQVLIANRDLIISQLDKYVETIFKPALNDVATLSLKVVCEVLFNHTDAISILSGVTEAMSVNSEISKEDALNLSVTDYTANWFASQIVIEQ